jgi:hypothetical protein
MLAGAAFEAESQATPIGRFWKSEPSLITGALQAPAALDRVMRICWRRTARIAGNRRETCGWRSTCRRRKSRGLLRETSPDGSGPQPRAAASAAVSGPRSPPRAATSGYPLPDIPPEGNQLFLTGSRIMILSPVGGGGFRRGRRQRWFRRVWIRSLDAFEAIRCPEPPWVDCSGLRTAASWVSSPMEGGKSGRVRWRAAAAVRSCERRVRWILAPSGTILSVILVAV